MNFEKNITPVRTRLMSHEIYRCIHTLEELKLFMSAHVFAVWDFMSLVKRLQIDLTCTQLPWLMSRNSQAARLINEIVFHEETDIDHKGNPCSHLEMYLGAMREVGVDTHMFESFIADIRQGVELPKAFINAKVPEFIANFVKRNIYHAIHGKTEEVVGSFLFSREDAIPDMFTLLLENWRIDREAVPTLIYYLERHIDLDGGEHGPAAHKILQDVVANDANKAERAMQAAIFAIENRIALWDGIVLQIQALRNTKAEQALTTA